MKGGVCKTCGEIVDVPMVKHKHDIHPEEYAQMQAKSAATRAAKAAVKKKKRKQLAENKANTNTGSMQGIHGNIMVTPEIKHADVEDADENEQAVDTTAPPPSGAPKPAGKPATKQTVAMGSVVTPKTGVVVLKLGPVEIDLEYEHLFNAHLLYNGMKKECGITDSFSHVVEQCIGICLEAMEKNAPIKEAVNGTSGRETEAEAVAESECELIAA